MQPASHHLRRQLRSASIETSSHDLAFTDIYHDSTHPYISTDRQPHILNTMSFLFGQRPQPSSAEKIAAAEAEIDMVSDMYNRCVAYCLSVRRQHPLTIIINSLVSTCTKKCIPPQYREADLNKGESVCLDRCVSKFFETNVKVSEKMQGEASANGGRGAMGGLM